MKGAISIATGILGWPYAYGSSIISPAGSGLDTKFIAVKVSADRVIKTIVGLRPYRPSGFVLRAEKIDSKLVVHNYGHGGGGVSLSWGTATMAVENVAQSDESNIAVAGCGVIGLSTALILQSKGFKVKIYSKDLPPDTTSNVAGALWGPVSVYEDNKVDIKFLNQFYLASKISHRIFQDLIGDKYGIWWIKNYTLGNGFHFPGGKDLYTGYVVHKDAKTYFGYPDVEEISTLMIETPVYLNALLKDFYQAGGKTEIKTLDTIQDFTILQEKIIMNCTGLGSGRLFSDKELSPVKGQLSILLPQPEIDYSYVATSENNILYMVPRKDGIILGGTSEMGNWSMKPNNQESVRILKGHAKISDSISG